MSRSTAEDLPAKYYLATALEVLRRVSGYGYFLTPQQQNFIAIFYSLDEDAQCLFLRMAARQEDFVKQDSLNYPELTNVAEHLHALQWHKLNRPVDPPRDWPQILRLLSKPELQKVLREDYQIPVKASQNKAQLLSLCSAQTGKLGRQALAICDSFTVRCQQGHLQYFTFLACGNFESCFRAYSLQSGFDRARYNAGRRLAVQFDQREQALAAFEFARHACSSDGAAANSAPVTADLTADYAVVDIETTGGRAAAHRITEIAIVKVRNQQIVGQWSSLVNPERPIPSMITELTGITNAMVATAPRFAEIAGEVETQLAGCVFVAHNARFDYGFIGVEFARIGRQLAMPRYCTVRETRQRCPGLTSYSLANLCREFDIDLGQHHRALCDALAAAQLLIRNLRHDQRAGEQ